jgi:tRNA(adenine34) deaminase
MLEVNRIPINRHFIEKISESPDMVIFRRKDYLNFSMGLIVNSDEYWMDFAIKEAEKALDAGEIPVGAIVVHADKIIGKGHNQREGLKDPTAHAEMLAITSAATFLDSWQLEDCTLYVTLEPCPMCAGAILNARISRVVFGAYDNAAGMCGSVENLCDQNLLNHKALVKGGVKADICRVLLNSFFNKIRSTDN